MARVTVEDCLQNVKNRFELVIIASKRARQLMRGSAEPKVAWENDKPTVVALREIAMGYTDFSDAHRAEPLTEADVFHVHTEHHAGETVHTEHEEDHTDADDDLSATTDEETPPAADESSEPSQTDDNPAESE